MTSVADLEMLIQGSTSTVKAEIWCFPERHGVTFSDAAYLEGPFSSRGKTLTTRFNFVRSKLGSHDAWKATIFDPVLWSPRMPALYKFGGLNGISTTIGLRDIRVKQDSFYWEDRRWVARAAAIDPFAQQLEEYSASSQGLVPIAPPLGSAILGEADRTGLPLIVDATQNKSDELASQISRLSAHVSVTMILLPNDCDEKHREAAHSHIRLGTFQQSGTQPPLWAEFIGISESLLSTGWKPERQLPTVATRECHLKNCTPPELRKLCDQFQAELDHGADYAGLWLFPKAIP